MRIVITEAHALHLADVEVLDDLRVVSELRPADWTAVDEVLRDAGAGNVSDGHALLSVKWLRATATRAGVPARWEAQFLGMLAYADRQGWMSTDGSVRAHVEWSQG